MCNLIYVPCLSLFYFSRFSISYQHNRFNNAVQFNPKLNSSTEETFTSAYTSLVQVGKCNAVLLYDVVDAQKKHFAYSIQIDIHMDRGGEAGIHC